MDDIMSALFLSFTFASSRFDVEFLKFFMNLYQKFILFI